MRQRKVAILLRVPDGHGRYPYHPAVMSANGTLKPFYALIQKKPALCKDGIYYLRYTDRQGKRRYQYAGVDPDQVRTLRFHREHIIAGENMGIFAIEPPAPQRPPRPGPASPQSVESLVPPGAPAPEVGSKRLALAKTVDKFVREMDVVRSRKRANEYRHKLGVFVGVFRKTYIDEVEDEDIVESGVAALVQLPL